MDDATNRIQARELHRLHGLHGAGLLPTRGRGGEGSMKTPMVIIDTDKCFGCGQCIKKCRQQSFRWSKQFRRYADAKIAEFVPSNCTMCGECPSFCKTNAIHIEDVEVKET